MLTATEHDTQTLRLVSDDGFVREKHQISGIVGKQDGGNPDEVHQAASRVTEETDYLAMPPIEAYISAKEFLETDYLPKLLERHIRKGMNPVQATTAVERTGIKARCELVDTLSQRGSGADNPELSIVQMMHNFQALVETNIVEPSNDPGIMRVRLMNELFELGYSSPAMLENIMAKATQDAQRKYNAYAKVLSRAGVSAEQRAIALDNLQGLKNEYEARKLGLRGEVMAYEICTSLVEQERFAEGVNKGLLAAGKNIGVSDLEIIHVNQGFDMYGSGDLALVGTVYDYGRDGISRDLLAVIDVKTERAAELVESGSFVRSQSGAVEPTVGIDNKFRAGSGKTGYGVGSDFDSETLETKKPLGIGSDRFVIKTGIPVLAVRLPWPSNYDLERKDGTMDITHFGDLAWGTAGLTTSRGIITNALQDLSVKSICGRYE